MSAKPACNNVKEATKYCKDVVAGKIPACKWVILACQRHLDDLELNKNKIIPYVLTKNELKESLNSSIAASHKRKMGGRKAKHQS